MHGFKPEVTISNHLALSCATFVEEIREKFVRETKLLET